MNRRSFLRSLGGAVAAAMLPFQKLPQLSAPKKAKEFSSTISPFWMQTTRASRCMDESYRKLYESLIVNSNPTLFGKGELNGRT
jgi:hypothetical protein